MDSCHIFNFLFGTKKATTELSKCFNSISEQTQAAVAKRRQTGNNGAINNNISQQPPRSPLKQLQMKIVSLTQAAAGGSGQKKAATTINQVPKPSQTPAISQKHKSCDQTDCCGTYRAHLVQSIDDEDYEQSSLSVVIENQSGSKRPQSVHLIENPVASLDDVVNYDDTKANVNNINQSSDCMKPSATITTNTYINPIQEEQDHLEESLAGKLTEPIHRTQPRQIVLYENELYQEDLTDVTQSESNKRICCDDNKEELEKNEEDSKKSSCKIGAGLYQYQCDINNNDHVITQPSTRLNDSEPDLRTAPRQQLVSSNSNSNSNTKSLMDKRSAYVRNIVQSFESTSRRQASIETADSTIMITPKRPLRSLNRSMTTTATPDHIHSSSPLGKQHFVSSQVKPITFVKPMPPKTPPKTIKTKYYTWQLSLANKPTKIEDLAQDEKFLNKLFNNLEPLDRCVAAQVCRKWRSILYANRDYWKDLVSVIDCTQLRRDQLVECIITTLQSATLKQQTRLAETKDPHQLQQRPTQKGNITFSNKAIATNGHSTIQQPNQESLNNIMSQIATGEANKRDLLNDLTMLEYLDQDDVWRIQELCNRYTHRNSGHLASRTSQNQIPNCPVQSHENGNTNGGDPQQQQQTIACLTSKSSSIPSQISSTFSSVSLSSLLSPLSESSRVESIKEKLYASLDERGFDAICLFGATDEDIEDLINKMPSGAHMRIQVARLNNCCITDHGLDMFVSTFNHIEELELSGCNEITNSIEFDKLYYLKSLIVTDCINIADGFAQRIVQIMARLEGLTVQAYHLTDAFIDYLTCNSDTSRLKRLELPDCKEVTNQSLLIIAKHLSHLEALSLSGSTKISDDGIEILVEQATNLRYLDLSWCTKITDASLECIACDLGTTLTDLILDRNVHITDNGIGYLATMSRLTLLHMRWCPRISDIGLEFVISIKPLKYLSVAGLQQITARSLLCLVETDLIEVELTNCQSVNNDLLMFLSSKMPKCSIIF